jgi:16S rRNA (uracil1498-N3)-methyltransferase
MAAEGTIRLTGDGHHHLVNVLRVTSGEELELFDGLGAAFRATVTGVTATEIVLDLGPAHDEPPQRRLIIIQGLPKGEKLEFVLQKGTELGVAAFCPVQCERSIVKLEGKATTRRARWLKIVEEAARQCGRADVPEVAALSSLSEAARGLAGESVVLVLDEEERAVPLSVGFARARASNQPVSLIVGPEGGLSRSEVAAVVALGAIPVTLGRRILRTETAALAAVSVLRFLDGHLG